MIRAAATLLLFLFSLLFWGIPAALMGIVKFAVQVTAPRSALRARVILTIARIADGWVATNNRIIDRMLPTRWDIAGVPDGLRLDGRYLVISNHVSWVDIFVVARVFHARTPFIRFFMKRRLIWFPIAGQACWALEFPFLRRYTAEYIARHPEKRGRDLQTARKACQRYRHIPVTILAFLEGTRFTREKHDDQESPYRHLLRPRSGAASFVVASLGDQLDGVLDATIAYPDDGVTFWDFVNGRVPRIVVSVRSLALPPEFVGGAIIEPGEARDRFRRWIESIWRDKDALLDALATAAGSPPG